MAISPQSDRPIDRILPKLEKAKPGGQDKWTACCPAHDDRHPSLSIAVGDDDRVLLTCHAGCATEDIVQSMDMTMADLFVPKTNDRGGTINKGRRIIATYDYVDARGELLYQSVRFEPKGFAQRRPNGEGGYAWNLKGIRRVLYRLPDILSADKDALVFIVEGEKDADRLSELGLIATTNSGGAGKFHLTDSVQLHGRNVAIIPDDDVAGRQHAEQVAKTVRGKAASVRIASLPDLSDKGDVSDWLDAGNTIETLRELVDQTEPYKPDGPTSLSWRPFPVEVLPQPMRNYVKQASKAIGCDASFIALPLLAMLASAIGNARRIWLKHSWSEPPIVWAVVVAESGDLKSPALDLALRPLRDRQQRAIDEYKEAMLLYEDEMIAYGRDLAQYKNGKLQDKPTKPEKPVCKRFMCSDVTVESLAILLEENSRGFLMARDELAGWFGGFNAYKSTRGADESHWLEMFGARPILVDRKSGDKKIIYVPRAAVSVAGTIQPVTLRNALGSEYFENGMAARLLLTMPPRRAKKWTEDELDKKVETAVADIVDKLLSLEMNVDGDGREDPVCVPLSPEGKNPWVKFFNEHAQEQAELSGRLASAWSKQEGYAARFALIIHFVRWAAGDPTLTNPDAIDAESVNAGVTLTRWFCQEARRVYAAFAESDEDRQHRHLIELIQRKGGAVSVRDWMRMQSHRTAGAAEAELESLVEAGVGDWEAPPPGSRGGRPSKVFRLSDKTPPETAKEEGDKNTTPSDEPGDGVSSVSVMSGEENPTSGDIPNNATDASGAHEGVSSEQPESESDTGNMAEWFGVEDSPPSKKREAPTQDDETSGDKDIFI